MNTARGANPLFWFVAVPVGMIYWAATPGGWALRIAIWLALAPTVAVGSIWADRRRRNRKRQTVCWCDVTYGNHPGWCTTQLPLTPGDGTTYATCNTCGNIWQHNPTKPAE